MLRIGKYIHQLDAWPNFVWNQGQLVSLMTTVAYKQGLLKGRMATLGFELQDEAAIEILSLDVVKTSAIEGELLDPEGVKSSIARKLGLNLGGAEKKDRHVDGIVAMLIDAGRNYDRPLTKERLCSWHFSLFPTGMNHLGKIKSGDYRDVEIAVTSGRLDKEEIFFEAPTPKRVPEEMDKFLSWVNNPYEEDPILVAAKAHLWFITIHPFDDGNGRIARAITDLLLARSDNSRQRFYSFSAQIEKVRKDYYVILEKTQKGSLDLTIWNKWFLEVLSDALDSADENLTQVLKKHRFWTDHRETILNARQRKVINKLLDGFEGGIQRNQYGRIVNTSKDTALRDLQDLVDKGVLKNVGKGRGAKYVLTYL